MSDTSGDKWERLRGLADFYASLKSASSVAKLGQGALALLDEVARNAETIREQSKAYAELSAASEHVEAALVEAQRQLVAMNEDGAGWKPVAEQAERQVRDAGAQALRDAANDYERSDNPPVQRIPKWLRARAAALSGVSGPTTEALDLETAQSIIASLQARLDAVSDLADHLVGNEAAPLIREALNGYTPARPTTEGVGDE